MTVLLALLLLQLSTGALQLIHRGDERGAQPNDDSEELPSEVLLYATQTSLFAAPFWSVSGQLKQTHFQILMALERYAFNVFSISYEDNLILFGEKTIYAIPIRSGKNCLNLKEIPVGGKRLGIDFENCFAVDWLDYNVYAFRKRQLVLHSLKTPNNSKVVVGNVQTMRNLVVESHKSPYFIAYIANEINIVRANKDGTSQMIVHTEMSRLIMCMTIDSRSGRFFFFVGETLKKAHFAVMLSIDYRTQSAPVHEASFSLKGPNSKVLEMAKFMEKVYVVLFEESTRHNKEYQLCQVMPQSSQCRTIVQSQSWPLTSLQTALRLPADRPDGCSPTKNKCPYLCTHHDRFGPVCICADSANCESNSNATTAPTAIQLGDSSAAIGVTNENGAITGLEDSPSEEVKSEGDQFLFWLCGGGLLLFILLLGAYLIYSNFSSQGDDGDGELSSLQAKSAKGASQRALSKGNKESAPLGFLSRWWQFIKSLFGFGTKQEDREEKEMEEMAQGSEVNNSSSNKLRSTSDASQSAHSSKAPATPRKKATKKKKKKRKKKSKSKSKSRDKTTPTTSGSQSTCKSARKKRTKEEATTSSSSSSSSPNAVGLEATGKKTRKLRAHKSFELRQEARAQERQELYAELEKLLGIKKRKKKRPKKLDGNSDSTKDPQPNLKSDSTKQTKPPGAP